MIETFLVSELGTISALNNQFYPVAAPVGDAEGNFCIYTRVSGDVVRDLTGEPVFYRDVYRLDLFGDDMDVLCALEQVVIDQLTKINVAFGDLYIFSAMAAPGAPDGFDLATKAFQRGIAYTVTYWR